MATGGLYGSTTTGNLVATSGAESTGLYGNNTNIGGTYFEWFIFQQSVSAPPTPTGGSWSFSTNVGTPPSGWSNTPPASPANPVWVSIAVVNSRTTTALSWSVPGQFVLPSGAGTVTSVGMTVPPFLSVTGSPVTTTGTLGVSLSGTPLPVTNGGTGTSTPSLVAGSNVVVTGTWPNQTIASTASGSVTSVTATSPVASTGGSTPVISMPAATGSTSGYLTNSDWTTFNNKQPAGSYLVSGGALGTPSSGTATNLTGLPLSTGVTGTLPVSNGGTGTTTPSLVAGTNVTVTGTWPNQTINSTGGGGSGTVTSVAATVPSFLSVTGSPITTSGTLSFGYSGTALPIANGGTGSTIGAITLPASTTSIIPLHFATGTQPTTPVQGDVWNESTGLYFHNSLYTNQLNLGANNAGTLSMPAITVTGSGATIDVGSVKAVLFSLPAWIGDYKEYVIPAATGLALTDNVANYLIVSYNAGTPVYSVTTNVALIDNSSIVGACLLWRSGTQVHYQAINWGLSTASRINRRLVQTNRYERASGLSLGESTGQVITLTAGNIWYGVNEIIEGAVTSASSNADFYYHVAGVDTKTTVSIYNNTQYDDGTALQTLSNGRYCVNWVYRYLDGAGLPKLAYTLGSGNYTLAQAVASAPPTPPSILTSMAILVGRIIVLKNATTATQIDSAFTQVFSSTTVTAHNDLSGLQGGTTNEYFHLTSSEYTGTGSGTFVRSTSPSLTTPLLGTPTSGNFSTGTFVWPTFNQNTTGNAATATNVPYSGLTGTVPTWNQNTTGTASNVTGTVAVANGGTGLTAAPTNGQLLIGNGTGFTESTLTAGSNVTITNAAGSITISASGGGGGSGAGNAYAWFLV